MWNDDLGTKVLREINSIQPYQYAPGSSNGMESWEEAEEALMKNYGGIFQSLDRKTAGQGAEYSLKWDVEVRSSQNKLVLSKPKTS